MVGTDFKRGGGHHWLPAGDGPTGNAACETVTADSGKPHIFMLCETKRFFKFEKFIASVTNVPEWTDFNQTTLMQASFIQYKIT